MIKHNARTASYTVVVGAVERIVTYDRHAGFEAKREAWQFAIELEAKAEAAQAAPELDVAAVNLELALAVQGDRYEPAAGEQVEVNAWLDECAEVALAPQAPAPEPIVTGPLAPTAEQLLATLDDWAQDATADGERAARAGDAAGVSYAAARIKAIGRARDAVNAAVTNGHTLVELTEGGTALVRGSDGWRTVAGDACDCQHGQRVAEHRAAVAAAAARGQLYRGRAPRGLCYHVMIAHAASAASEAMVEAAQDWARAA